MTVADLIIRGLGGDHLHDFLPGCDNRSAISRAVSSKRGWSGPGMGWGEVTSDGIGEWPAPADYRNFRRSRRPGAAMSFVPWAEVLDVIRRGCSDGYREAYEAAYAAWGAAVHEAWKDFKPSQSASPARVDPRGIDETKRALIRHGCERIEVQDALF